MGRKRKNQNPSQNPEEESITSSETQENPEQVIDEVEGHDASKPTMSLSGLLDRARDNLTSDAPEPPKSKWSKYKASKNKNEVTTAISSLLVLFLASWKVPDELKPNEAETEAVSNYATRLLLRHVDLSGRLTADALDVIGIVAVLSGYYARTASNWREYRDLQAATVLDVPNVRQIDPRPRKPQEDKPTSNDPIGEIDPNAANFLNRPRGKENDRA